MATRLTNYKKGAMRAANLTQAPRNTPHVASGHKSKNLPEIPPVTLRAAKAAHNLPANVIDQAIKITRKRYALYNPSVNVKRLRGAELKSTLEKFLLSRAPDPTLLDDWVVVADDHWPERHPYRLSMAIVLARKSVLNSSRALKWRHVLEGDWPIIPAPYKERNGLPTVMYIPDPPPENVIQVPIPEKPGINKPSFAIPTLEEIKAEDDEEYCRFLQTVFLPPEQHFIPIRLGEPPAVTPVDDDGLIDPLALLLKPAAHLDNDAAKADVEQDHEDETED